MPTALVTGARAGLGRAFAQRLAADGYGLVLVARDADRLEALAASLRAGGTDVAVLAADLTDRAACLRVEERLADDSRPVDLLVNAAGFGLKTPFLVTAADDEERMLDIHVRAVLRLSRAALPGMVRRGSGAVLNVSSVAGWLPRGTYSAHKAWVTTFTEGLAGPLRGTGVQAMALAPGFVRTEFHQRAGMRATAAPPGMWLQPEAVVDAALRDLRRGRLVSVPTLRYRAAVAAMRLAPRRLLALGGYAFRWR
ncbi:MAG TPA: SDR family oxidoreductase [Ornithinibacter sp.]|nr:SDR family oxidoreductase [Ornithinibacter sp.]